MGDRGEGKAQTLAKSTLQALSDLMPISTGHRNEKTHRLFHHPF